MKKEWAKNRISKRSMISHKITVLKKMNRKLKVLMSGGGTGGHIFPAVAIAQEIQKRFPDAEFLFIGAN